MAAEIPLIEWALSRVDLLSLRIQRNTWTNEWCLGQHDLKASMILGGHSFEGRGFSSNENVALVVAISECIERAVAFANNLSTSSGVACHDSVEAARMSAINELIERDRFFCHFFLKHPFLKLKSRRSKSFFFMQNKN